MLLPSGNDAGHLLAEYFGEFLYEKKQVKGPVNTVINPYDQVKTPIP